VSGLVFEINWETGLAGNISPELRETFAHLAITVNGQSVTNCVVGDGIKKRVLIPLYPLVEWFALNWWRLIHEPLCPGRGISESDFLTRHGLLDSRDGFALPDLRFYPEGDRIKLKWLRHQMAHQPLEFFNDGEALLDCQQVVEALSGLVETVLERLANQGIRQTRLGAEWAAIHKSSPDEVLFCETAARLGLDPFDISEAQSDLILETLGNLPIKLRDELASAVTIEHLAAVSHWIETRIGQSNLVRQGHDLNWKQIKNQVKVTSQDKPWDEGYDLANEFREFLPAQATVPVQLPDYAALTLHGPIPASTIDALVIVQSDSAPVCLTGRNQLVSQRFQFARSICEYLTLPPNTSTLLTNVHNRDQKRSRAFAAELLAPKAELQARLKTDTVTREDAEDLASEFQVSSWVIVNQLKNHHLAAVLESPE